MQPILLEHPLSPYSQKNKIALREKGVDFELRMMGADSAGGLAANPRHEVSVFLHDGQTIFDSTVIQEYIEDSWPQRSLLPAVPAERARVRMIEEVMDTQYEAVVWGFMEVITFGRAPGAAGQALLARGREQLSGLHVWLTRELGERKWFNGERFGWGDIAVAPFVLGAGYYDAGPATGSALGQWLARVLERPSVSSSAAEAAAFQASAGDAAVQALASGLYKREYRDHRLEWMLRSGGIEVLRDGLAADNIRFSSEIS